MKKLYQLHIVALIILGLLGIYFVNGYYNAMADWFKAIGEVDLESTNYKSYGRNYGICSLFFFALSFVVGVKTWSRLRKTGGLLVVGSIFFFLWSLGMIESPGAIGVHEVYPAWVAYIIVAIGLSWIGIKQYDTVQVKSYGQEDVLDDLDGLL